MSEIYTLPLRPARTSVLLNPNYFNNAWILSRTFTTFWIHCSKHHSLRLQNKNAILQSHLFFTIFAGEWWLNYSTWLAKVNVNPLSLRFMLFVNSHYDNYQTILRHTSSHPFSDSQLNHKTFSNIFSLRSSTSQRCRSPKNLVTSSNIVNITFLFHLFTN